MPRKALLTDQEKAAIEARLHELPDVAVDDPDNPEWTEADFARAQGPESLPPDVLAAFPKTVARLRGKQKAPTKAATSIRLDQKVLDHFKATGRGWQSRINDALLDLIEHPRRQP